jgi:hypothetical protein
MATVHSSLITRATNNADMTDLQKLVDTLDKPAPSVDASDTNAALVLALEKAMLAADKAQCHFLGDKLRRALHGLNVAA